MTTMPLTRTAVSSTATAGPVPPAGRTRGAPGRRRPRRAGADASRGRDPARDGGAARPAAAAVAAEVAAAAALGVPGAAGAGPGASRGRRRRGPRRAPALRRRGTILSCSTWEGRTCRSSELVCF
jgi:hypothetical protein